jgi:AraC family transcriptional regulator
VKENTLLFYERVVRAAAECIVGGMDDALDLAELAERAALSPLHFHRIFRGMLGETPLELHRRLRLERAAWRLTFAHSRITQVAFEAGYETHESFTRAFREAYGLAPSEFRERAQVPRTRREQSRLFELAAGSGLHFRDPSEPDVPWSITQGENRMKVDIQTLPDQRVAALSHTGPYNTISAAFARLSAIAGPAGLFGHPGAAMVAIFHDDPETRPAAELRSDAGIVVAAQMALPEPLHEVRLPAGRYACTTHVGPYEGLGDVWAHFMGRWLAQSGHRVGSGAMFELYRNSPMDTSPSELVTDLYLSIV